MPVLRLEGCPDGHVCCYLDKFRKLYQKFRNKRTAAMKALARVIMNKYVTDANKVAYCREWLENYYSDMIK